MDERTDLVRTVTDGRFVYCRNFMPHLPHGQHVGYQFQTPTTRIWNEMYEAGQLTPVQAAFWSRRPPEELYDLVNDPDETINLAGDPRPCRDTRPTARTRWSTICWRSGTRA